LTILSIRTQNFTFIVSILSDDSFYGDGRKLVVPDPAAPASDDAAEEEDDSQNGGHYEEDFTDVSDENWPREEEERVFSPR